MSDSVSAAVDVGWGRGNGCRSLVGLSCELAVVGSVCVDSASMTGDEVV